MTMAEKNSSTMNQRGDEIVVAGSGEMDLTNLQRFQDELMGASTSDAPVSVDLRSVVFIDSAVLACLAEAAREMTDRGGRLKILMVEEGYPLYVLSMVGFDALMDFVTVPA